MPSQTAAGVRRQIGSAAPDPVYLLFGDDDVETMALAREFEELVEEDLRPFNVERIHAGDFTTGEKLVSGIDSLIAAARTLPMMSPRRVVVVPGAGALLAPKRESEAVSRALDALEGFLKQPAHLTVLVLVATSVDKRGRVYKLLLRHATLVECGVLEDRADAERWIRNRVAAAGARIDQTAARLLVARCGTDVRRLRSDLDRLLLYTLGQPAIGPEDVRQVVGAAELQDDWAMTNAVEAGDGASALKQLALLIEAGTPPEKILGQLAWLVRAKLAGTAPGALARAAGALFRTDQALKRSGGDPRVLLERLVVELCGPRR